jgi:hypothetical protein
VIREGSESLTGSKPEFKMPEMARTAGLRGREGGTEHVLSTQNGSVPAEGLLLPAYFLLFESFEHLNFA